MASSWSAGMRKKPRICGECRVMRQHPVGAGRLEQIGHEARGDRDARLVLLVAARVGEIGQDRGDARGRGELERVDDDEQLDDAVATAAGEEVWMTKTSCSRTFSSILTLMFSFENRVGAQPSRGTPASVAMALARAGWLLPAKIFRIDERLKAPDLSRRDSHRLGAEGLAWENQRHGDGSHHGSESRHRAGAGGSAGGARRSGRSRPAGGRARSSRGLGVRVEEGVDVTSDQAVAALAHRSWG